MSMSDNVKALLTLTGKKQMQLASCFGMAKQAMNNKMRRDSWSANDLAKVAEFCGYKLAFIGPNGTQITLNYDPKKKENPEA